MEDRIVAISSGMTDAGIAIVRLSGEGTKKALEEVFVPAKGKILPRHMHYGKIVDGDVVIDEVMAVYLPEPHTYTREDMAEIYTHGGMKSPMRVFSILEEKGARAAERGEFTKRAFLNGRIDLTQAEAVVDIVRARTETEHMHAVDSLSGSLGKIYADLSEKLLNANAHLTMLIDFTEDLEDTVDLTPVEKEIAEILTLMENYLARTNRGKILRTGIETTILGRPNVGKSSLLNALLSESRAIVTDVPGTTRDVVRESLDFGGIPLNLSDTAGIRETEDVVEAIGVERSKKALASADLVLAVLDGSDRLTDEDIAILKMIGDKPAIVLLNKRDLGEKISREEVLAILPEARVIPTSILREEGIVAVEEAIEALFFDGVDAKSGELLMATKRQEELLKGSYDALTQAHEDLLRGVSPELVDVNLKEAWSKVAAITGEVHTEDVIDRVFSDFCIGK